MGTALTNGFTNFQLKAINKLDTGKPQDHPDNLKILERVGLTFDRRIEQIVKLSDVKNKQG